jgi:hypothetical protein
MGNEEICYMYATSDLERERPEILTMERFVLSRKMDDCKV